MTTRRTVLSIAGAATIVGTGGCLAPPFDATDPEDDPASASSENGAGDDGDEDGTPENETESNSDAEPEASEARSDDPETDVHGYETVAENDNVEYLGDGTVEIVVARSGDEPIDTVTESFDDWADVRCARIAADAMVDYLEDRLENRRGIGVGSSTAEDGDHEYEVTVSYGTTYDRDGELVSEPAIEFDRLVSVTPKTAAGTLAAGDREATREYPVRVRRSEMYLD